MLALVCLRGEDVASQRLEALEVRRLGFFEQLPNDGLSAQSTRAPLVEAQCMEKI